MSGDIVVLATDGVYDNVYESQIVDLVEATLDQEPNVIAQAIVAYSRQVLRCPSPLSLSPPLPFSLSRLFTQIKVQEDPAAYVPYGVEAAAAGKEWAGGKLDDTCALVLKFQ